MTISMTKMMTMTMTIKVKHLILRMMINCDAHIWLGNLNTPTSVLVVAIITRAGIHKFTAGDACYVGHPIGTNWRKRGQ